MRIARIFAAIAAAGLSATGLAAAPAQAAPAPGPMLLTRAVKAVHSGKPTWINAYWGTTGNICDAGVTVRVANADVWYPTNTAPRTSFFRGDSLAAGDYDYTAFRVTTKADRTLVRAVHLTIDYRDGSKDDCTGPEKTRTFYATLAVRKG
jgi:hypothetical protein